MRVSRGVSCSLSILYLLLACCALSAQNTGHRVRNIVLVHGAWADGSGWKGVYDILVKHGFNVRIVQEPLTSFQEDVAATKRVLAQLKGRCILVAHSYGGSVITEAGTEPSVAGLVYIAAHMPDAGESEADGGKRFPSDLSKSTAIKKTGDDFDYLDPAQFHAYFAADLPVEQAAFEARSQVLIADANFKAVITTPAWRSKPSWMLVAAKDRTINPDLERWYAKRAKSHKVEVAGASHSVYVSRPKEVAALIEEAAATLARRDSQVSKPSGMPRAGRMEKTTMEAKKEIETRNKQTIQAGFDAWKKGTGGVFDLLAPDAMWTIVGNSPVSKTYTSRQEFLDVVITPFNARLSSRLVPTVHGLYAEDDMVIALFDAEGTARDGKPYRNTYSWYMQLHEGQIVNVTAFFDTIEFTDFWTRIKPE